MTKSPIEQGWKLENSYSRLPELFFTRLGPALVPAPRLAVLNESLAASLGLSVRALRSGEGVAVLAGNSLPEGAQPLAQAYAGHQFGYFTVLGDGRALLLGEQITPQGERFDIQLKGSGRTPYSRRGDGRAALGPMLREYIISEAMYALGIPTTRSLAVVTTGGNIIRETLQPGAVLTRVAASHLRVGTFEYALHLGTAADLRALADYTLERHFPGADDAENRYLFLLKEVIKRQAALIAKWQAVGFIHGVMNTDNMALSGETIDYGPCAFMDTYDPATVFSSIDRQGRYAFGNQPLIAGWNLARFAETLLPLLHETEDMAIGMAEDALAEYDALYRSHWLAGMKAKLGLKGEEEEDQTLIESFLGLLHRHRADYTNAFRALSLGTMEETPWCAAPEYPKWLADWQARLGRQQLTGEEVRRLMRDNNPAVIPRNHRVEAALAAAEEGDYSVLERLLEALAQPYAYDSEQDAYALPPEPSDQPYRTFCGT